MSYADYLLNGFLVFAIIVSVISGIGVAVEMEEHRAWAFLLPVLFAVVVFAWATLAWRSEVGLA